MKRILLFGMLVTMGISAFGWSQKGHDVTAYIAEQHLTPAAKQAVDNILSGRSMVYWANWLDNASHTPEYAYSKTWHYKNIDEGEQYEESKANPAGDAVTAIKAQIEKLSDASATDTDRELAMKILVHVMGDMHQPLHMGHATDLGGNRTKVKFFGRDTNLHSVWDGSIVESGHKWSYSEWQEQIDRVSPEEVQAIVAGTIDDWAKETMLEAAQVYRFTKPGDNLSYNEVARWTPVVETQLLRGGLRLAYVLNMLFDSEYAAANTAPYVPAK
ncbi:MAG: S1/P1 nuclease [Bacteroides sp.]|nr:S1/P1 nuclease [Bacteroides sp.]MCM1413670.1 S1/P1 nuclease [Bacteroides sp.]MCM1471849.1 S1/P1 nuclease [Bacteroides sp.]